MLKDTIIEVSVPTDSETGKENDSDIISLVKEPLVNSFSFKEFLEKMNEDKPKIENFVFLGDDDKGNTIISAKASNGIQLYFIVKRFLTSMEKNFFG